VCRAISESGEDQSDWLRDALLSKATPGGGAGVAGVISRFVYVCFLYSEKILGVCSVGSLRGPMSRNVCGVNGRG
jgi:hypothetical protein